MIQPSPDDEDGLLEARSAWLIGRHLFEKGIPVPCPLDFDRDSGTLWVEDLGDERFHDRLRACDPETRYQWYARAVEELVRMQVRGAEGFSASWCWDTGRYDRSLMLERESGYFLQALCADLLGLTWDQQAVQRECERLADRTAAIAAHYFLHRDFQSRNLMIKDGKVRIIDYQGGRLGPLAYDLAALLLDPYMGLDQEFQDRMFALYVDVLTRCLDYDPAQFRREYHLLALQRNLQILGAFAFLGHRRGKRFFLPFIEPALGTLKSLLAKADDGGYPGLSGLVDRCLEHPVLERLRQGSWPGSSSPSSQDLSP